MLLEGAREGQFDTRDRRQETAGTMRIRLAISTVLIAGLSLLTRAQTGTPSPSAPSSPTAGTPEVTGAQPATPPRSATATVRGRVVSADDSRPIRRAQIDVWPDPFQAGTTYEAV